MKSFTMKKALRETQTLRAGRSNAEPKNFAPPQKPFPGAQDRQNLISWRRSLPSPTDPVWWRSMHAISSYRGNSHRPPVRPPHTHKQDQLQHTAPQLASASVITILAGLCKQVTDSVDEWHWFGTGLGKSFNKLQGWLGLGVQEVAGLGRGRG